MSEYANYVEQAAYEDGLEKGRQESRKRIRELEAREEELVTMVETIRNNLHPRISELERVIYNCCDPMDATEEDAAVIEEIARRALP